MKRMFLAAAVAAMMIQPAAAMDAAGLSQQADTCWSVPAAAANATVEFEVVLFGKGEVGKISLMSYGPETAYADELVSSAETAIRLCQPYSEIGTFRFVMDGRMAGGTH